MVDPNPQVGGRGLRMLSEAGIKTDFGLLASEAEALNPGFFKRMRTAFPRVTVKLGASLDGRTAMASGESQWITSPMRAAMCNGCGPATMRYSPALKPCWPMVPP